MSADTLILLAAGGTGGHLFPAQSLACALLARGARVQLATDERALNYGGEFPAEATHEIASATPMGGGLGAKARAALALGKGVLQAYGLLGRIKPRALVSFGGYPTVPPALAATLRGVPLILHEQNAVMGRANKFLSQRAHLAIVQQARGEDLIRVQAAYARLHVEAEVAPFFADLPARIAAAHLVVGRSGASTVSELAAIGRPSILVPFPHALDADQAANARHLEAAGAAQVMRQTGFTPAWLAQQIVHALADPGGLTRGAQAAKSAGVPDAAERLAELTLRTAGLAP